MSRARKKKNRYDWSKGTIAENPFRVPKERGFFSHAHTHTHRRSNAFRVSYELLYCRSAIESALKATTTPEKLLSRVYSVEYFYYASPQHSGPNQSEWNN